MDKPGNLCHLICQISRQILFPESWHSQCYQRRYDDHQGSDTLLIFSERHGGVKISHLVKRLNNSGKGKRGRDTVISGRDHASLSSREMFQQMLMVLLVNRWHNGSCVPPPQFLSSTPTMLIWKTAHLPCYHSFSFYLYSFVLGVTFQFCIFYFIHARVKLLEKFCPSHDIIQ